MHPEIPSVPVDQVPTPLPDGLTVLDVREPVEWEQAHVPGSVHIPLGELPTRLAELPGDTQLLVVCAVGARSARAVQYLLQHGHDAVNLDGGLMEWQGAGRELVAGTA
ncbi:MAG: rhodanese-like domain-containing protein [Nocardioides sp.]|jgi:rhodanese-related sulfurtransferase